MVSWIGFLAIFTMDYDCYFKTDMKKKFKLEFDKAKYYC